MAISNEKKSASVKKAVKGLIFKKMMHKMDESKKHEMAKGDKMEDKGEMMGKGGPGKKC